MDFSVEGAQIALAKAHFDMKEYRRCAHALESLNSAKSNFLRLYSLFLVRESENFVAKNLFRVFRATKRTYR